MFDPEEDRETNRFNDAKVAAGITLHLHDLRGTFATRCMIAGLTDQEIADILEIDEKTVKSRLFEARQRLRAALKDYRPASA